MWSFAKYEKEVVIPHLNSPSSGSNSPAKILNRVVFASSFEPTNATLSFAFKINETLSKTLTPSTVFEILETVKISFPISLFGLKSI